ncbi:MAG: ATP-binding cassette domain-containing protein, partial [Rhodospirillales bacterium]|nr:ATP-binding cassette domain-containing protein [Rhodospirillales bacterium]
ARVVGAVLEAQGFHPARTGRRHLLACAAAVGVPDAAVDVGLGAVGLIDAADRAVGGYSLGMQQRLALAVAMLGDPQVLILDEPGNGLDPEGIAWMRSFLRGFAARGGTVLVSSHLLGEIEQTADHLVVVSRGRCVYQGGLDQLRACMQVYAEIVVQPFGMCLIRVGDEEVPEPSRTELRRMKSEIDLAFRRHPLLTRGRGRQLQGRPEAGFMPEPARGLAACGRDSPAPLGMRDEIAFRLHVTVCVG